VEPLNLCYVMREFECKSIVFSSSATVYGDPKSVPIREDFPVGGVTNPYGRSKLFIEEILRDLYTSDSSWKIVILRYFNLLELMRVEILGKTQIGVPNNLMAIYISSGSWKERVSKCIWR